MGLHLLQIDLDARIDKYGLLEHPFYLAWFRGELSRDDLLRYAERYYHHIASLPHYLTQVIIRTSEVRVVVAAAQHLMDELAGGYVDGKPHTELWLDFVQGMGGDRKHVQVVRPPDEINQLINRYMRLAKQGSVIENLAALYAYESQVQRLSSEQLRALKECYEADESTCRYFAVHASEHAEHDQVCLEQIAAQVQSGANRDIALNTAETAAKWLSTALDGIDLRRAATVPVAASVPSPASAPAAVPMAAAVAITPLSFAVT